MKRAPLGKLFLDLMLDKVSWPLNLVGSGCYLEQPSMNEALLEAVAFEMGAQYDSDCLPQLFVEPVADGNFQCNYLGHLLCFKRHLERMVGPFGARKSRKVFFMPPHSVADMNFRPHGNVPDGGLASFQYRPFMWHWVNYRPKRQVMLEHLNLTPLAASQLPRYPPQEGNDSTWRHFEKQEKAWCRRHVKPGSCTLVSPQEVCQHLKPGVVQYC